MIKNKLVDTNNYLILCDTYNIDENNFNIIPTQTNNHHNAKKIFENEIIKEADCWFGIEQEYFIVDPVTDKVVGFGEINKSLNIINNKEYKKKQGPFYCGVGASNIFGRKIAELHMVTCLEYGLKISGINAEVAYGQWEYQIGPLNGLEVSHQLHLSRFILMRIAEDHGYDITFEPKPIFYKNWNGSGCHTNFSTRLMREGNEYKNGIEFIYDAMKKLETKHKEHILVYGSGNELRLTGENETSSIEYFSWGIGKRNTSVRIGNNVYLNQCGYFEDRRPSSNMDPYLVTSKLVQTILLDD